MSYCSPSNKDFKNTCYTLKELRFFAKQYNESLGNHKSPHKIDLSLSKPNLLQKLNEKFGNIHESKWIDTNYLTDVSRNVKNNLRSNFVPSTPRSWLVNKNKWLTNFDIQNVIQQYEEEFPSFKFLGVHPIDFAARTTYNNQCISPVICSLDVKLSIKNKKTKIGIVFNLDRHDQSGSHWVTLVCELSIEDKNFGCHYIDSTGAPVPPQIYTLMLNIKDQVNVLYKNNPNVKHFKLFQNLKKFQKGNTECGMFAIYFVTKFVSSKLSIPKLLSKHITDNDVFKLRSLMYNPHKIVD